MIEPIRAPFPMSQPQLPSFSDRCVDIRAHGARPGGSAINTVAIDRARRP